MILIKGAVPGSKGAILVIRDAIKPKSLVAKVKTDEVVETAGKEKKPESKDDKTEEQITEAKIVTLDGIIIGNKSILADLI